MNGRFDHLTVRDGLSQSGVTCIFQDTKGFMWFGTQDGLNRYDGYTSTVYKHDPSDSTSIADNFIVLIGEDSSGSVWVGTLDIPDQLSRFEWDTETFTHRHRDSVQLNNARTSRTFSVYQTPDGIRWTGSVGGGVTRTDLGTGEARTYRNDPSDPGSLLSDKVYSVYGDRSGTLWIGTQKGLERYDETRDRFIHYQHRENDASSLSHNWVWPILEDRSGTLWLGTFGGGLNRFDREKGTFTAYRNDEADPKSIADDRMYSLFQDASGIIWIGTADQGADRFPAERMAFRHIASSPSRPEGLSNNTITALCVDDKGGVWIGSTSGLDHYDPRRNVFRHFRNDPARRNTLGSSGIVKIIQDRDGFIWIGFVNGGLDRLDPGTGTFRHFRNNPDDPSSLSDDRVYALLEDTKGRFWVGTYGGGLNLLDRQKGTFRRYEHNADDSTSLGAAGVWSLAEDPDGSLWVGTYGGGLDHFDPETGTFTHYAHDGADPSSLTDNTVLTLTIDSDGSLWAGTFAGLNLLDRDVGRFTTFREKDGLPNAVILGILEDEKGYLWISTNTGLSKLDRGRREFRNFDSNDGLQGDEFNHNAYARDPHNGLMYFGGTNGFNIFHPDSVRENPYVPPVVFSSFFRYNTDVKEGEPIFERGIPVRESIMLSYKDNVAVFEFAALNYHNTPRNQYAYFLDGYTEGWIQLGNDRRATFTNLDAGTYVLRVRGSNDDRVWNTEGASMEVIVTPPWWKTTWAYGTYLLIVVGILAVIRRFENERREQKARVRESELREKAAVAEKRVLEAENERKSQELEQARQLQLSLLPKEVPQVPGYEIAVALRTATEVGGDYYDFHVSEDGSLNVAVGDATGHGMQAGTIVTLMKGLFLSEGARADIQAFFAHSSRAIKDIKLGRLFMAFTLLRLNKNRVSFSCAGMPPVFLFRANTGSVEEVLLKGLPLGAMKKATYAIHETAVDRGDVLLLLSDGLPEQKNTEDEMFDYARVGSVLKAHADRPASEIVDALVSAGEQWMGGAVQEDDITVLVIRPER